MSVSYEVLEPKSPSVGSFSSTGIFTPNAVGQKLLDYYRTTQKQPLEVRPLPPNERPGTLGVYYSLGTPDTPFGGSSDPTKRIIYLKPSEGTDAFTLAHEAGHAYDPSLLKATRDLETNFNRIAPSLVNTLSQRSGLITDPVSYLNTYIDFMGPRKTLHSETTAQKAARDTLSALSVEAPEIYNPYFGGYPKSSIDQGIYSITSALSTPDLPYADKQVAVNAALGGQRLSRYTGPSSDVEIDLRDERLRREANLALNPAWNRAVKNIEDRTATFLQRELPRPLPPGSTIGY